MNRLLHKIRTHRNFLMFILVFSYLDSIIYRIRTHQVINVYTFTPEGAIANLIGVGVLFLILLYSIKKWQKSALFAWKEFFKIAGFSLVAYFLLTLFAQALISLIFDNFERNFNPSSLLFSMTSTAFGAFIYGGFFLAYYYLQKHNAQQVKIQKYQQAIAQHNIQQLKHQLNPHFLFNNLNVLDQLIAEDKDKASEFLNDFAEIYRYVLESSTHNTIAIEDEINFAKRYFNLIRHKYGDAYQLHIAKHRIQGKIVPLTLQLLIENVVKHNVGTESNPIVIHLHIEDQITCQNNRVPKKYAGNYSGKGLKNLQTQYQLLAQEGWSVEETPETFTVSFPIIIKES
jgi:sensor histidine kinase YesM